MSKYVCFEDVGKMALSMMGISNTEWVHVIQGLPTIEIVRCPECKWEWTQKCPPHRMGLIHDSSDFCSYGVRKEISETDKHDKAIEALGYLMKQTKGGDDETD